MRRSGRCCRRPNRCTCCDASLASASRCWESRWTSTPGTSSASTVARFRRTDERQHANPLPAVTRHPQGSSAASRTAPEGRHARRPTARWSQPRTVPTASILHAGRDLSRDGAGPYLGRPPPPHPTRIPRLAGAAGGYAGEDGLSGYFLAAAGDASRRAPRDPAGSNHLLPPSSRRDGIGHCVDFAAAVVSMACSSLASSASSSPISTRSSGLMNPSLSRKPPARAIASRSGTAQ